MRSRSIPIATWIKLPIFWVLTLGVVLGPYAALVYGLPWFAERQGWSWAELTEEKMAGFLNPYYWVAMAVYLALARAFTPSYDSENLGWFGVRRFDNPFTFEDNVNRAMQNLAFFLFPGKFVWFTLGGTFALVKRIFGA